MYKWQLRGRKGCLTQEELVKAYEGPDFDLADRYGEVTPFPAALILLYASPVSAIPQFCTCLYSGHLSRSKPGCDTMLQRDVVNSMHVS